MSTVTPSTPAFDNSKVTVIFVLGGPGAGKGTQCTHLVDDFDLCHISVGDLLRTEQKREGSQDAETISTCIREGKIVPMKITGELLKNAMTAALNEGRTGDGWKDGKGRFLIDGFPRVKKQACEFDKTVCLSSLVIFYSTEEEVLLSRLNERGKTSGREDDNEESIKKRLETYEKVTKPVIEYYEPLGKVAKIDCSGTIEEVREKTKVVVEKFFSTGKYSAKVAA